MIAQSMSSSAGRGCRPGCGVVWIVFIAGLVIPTVLARFTDTGLAGPTFGVLMLCCLVLGYFIRGDERIFFFCIHTRKFPTEPEGYESNNKMPGSAVVEHMKRLLNGKIERADESIQEDWGWGFYCFKDLCRIWVGASYAMPQVGAKPDTAEWTISTAHERVYWISQWFRSFRGLRVAKEVHGYLLAAFKSDPEVEIVWGEDPTFGQ